MVQFNAALPSIQSAIVTSGEAGGQTKIKFDCNLTGGQYEQLQALRGKSLIVTIHAADELTETNSMRHFRDDYEEGEPPDANSSSITAGTIRAPRIPEVYP